jgi:hypothetical protein
MSMPLPPPSALISDWVVEVELVEEVVVMIGRTVSGPRP